MKKLESKTEVKSGGIGFCGLLTIVFIVLKLGVGRGVMAWSWWWVLSPLWIPIVVFFVIMLAILVIGLIVAAIAKLLE